MLRGYNSRAGGANVNRYDAGTDTVLRLLREIYRRGEPHAVTLGAVPSGGALSVLLTHDIDYNKSVENSLAYAAYERSRGLRATYFVQTKYVRDYNDRAFFDDRGVALLKRLAATGMEIASHTVAHSRAFLTFPMGTGVEAFPSYRPFVKDRPGNLEIPAALPQELVATGYRFSSAATANDARTHLPFQLTYGRGFSSDTPIFELPISVEDERGPLPLARVDQVIDLATRLSACGGSLVVLIHPNVVGDKLEFERRLVEAVRDRAWFGSISDYGSWWAARNAAEIDVTETGANPTVHVHAPDRIDGLTLTVPAGWRFLASAPGTVPVKAAKGVVILGPIVGDVALHFQQSSHDPAGNSR